MALRSLEELCERVRSSGRVKTVALVRAGDATVLEPVLRLQSEGLLRAVLIGNRADIHAAAHALGRTVCDGAILDAQDATAAAALGVRLVREGRADILMKGRLDTASLLKAVSSKTDGVAGGVLSHMALNQLPSYHKLLAVTDGELLPYPTLQQKKQLIENTVSALHALGYEKPKVCILTAAERVNPRMPETIEAAALKEMNQTEHITGCTIEGPIPLDLALRREQAVAAGYSSPCAGDADVLVAPNIHAGSILGKSLAALSGGKAAALALGACCPIVLTSSCASAEEKYHSLILACATCIS